ncbi:hypothetical protein [Pontibacter rugosus]|uniref:Uncharacterized protein n=1 Tax=Pontibacter rugosus TaxID=1745966 RepID=A0ABW3STT1_9BACT
MKKLLFAGAIIFGSVGLYSCGNEGATTAETEGTVIDQDTAVSELEVERTVIDTDTTTETETIETENQVN